MYVQIGSSVKIYMLACAKQLATTNRLQRYNKNLKYTKEFMFFVVFFAFAHANHILSEYTA